MQKALMKYLPPGKQFELPKITPLLSAKGRKSPVDSFFQSIPEQEDKTEHAQDIGTPEKTESRSIVNLELEAYTPASPRTKVEAMLNSPVTVAAAAANISHARIGPLSLSELVRKYPDAVRLGASDVSY